MHRAPQYQTHYVRPEESGHPCTGTGSGGLGSDCRGCGGVPCSGECSRNTVVWWLSVGDTFFIQHLPFGLPLLSGPFDCVCENGRHGKWEEGVGRRRCCNSPGDPTQAVTEQWMAITKKKLLVLTILLYVLCISGNAKFTCTLQQLHQC